MLTLTFVCVNAILLGGIVMNFSQRLIATRKLRNLTQRQLAAAIKLSEVGIQNYESGRRKPAFEILVTIAEFLDVSIDYLVGRTDKSNSHKL